MLSPAHYNRESGIALPAALLLVMFIASVGGLLSFISISEMQQVKQVDMIERNFNASEGATHDVFSQMATASEMWREMSPLADLPSGYTEFSPVSYASTNGIPPCSGVGCHRQMFPTGGGLIKNFGPFGAEGSEVDTSWSIVDQLDWADTPTNDVSLNSQDAWAQVERLDEVSVSSESVGGSLENNNTGGSGSSSIRFRVTGVSLNSLRGRRGVSTLIYVVELPST